MAKDATDDIDAAQFAFDHPTVRGDIESVHSSPVPWDLLEGKSVLISGAAGMLPAAIVDALMAARSGPRKLDVKVIALVRSATRGKLRFHHWLQDDSFSLL